MPDSQQQTSIGWCRDKTDLACVDFLPELFFGDVLVAYGCSVSIQW